MPAALTTSSLNCKDLKAQRQKEDCEAWRKKRFKLGILTKRSSEDHIQILMGLKIVSSGLLLLPHLKNPKWHYEILDRQDCELEDLDARRKGDDKEDR